MLHPHRTLPSGDILLVLAIHAVFKDRATSPGLCKSVAAVQGGVLIGQFDKSAIDACTPWCVLY